VKLWRATGDKRYLRLSKYFLDERGRRPHYYDAEATARGEDPAGFWAGGYGYLQAHVPVRRQRTAEGHAVRAMYLFSAMADVAGETGDAELLAACKRLWRNVTERRMYVTGGVGSSAAGERFTFDYDLPNESAYAETCAAIGLVFWAHRMLHLTGDGRCADVMERALYNAVLAGVSLDGGRFFYANPLAVVPDALRFQKGPMTAERQEWFGCACCPPNVARLLASLPRYAYSVADGQAWVHLYAQSRAALDLGPVKVLLTQATGYPWRGDVCIAVTPEHPARFVLCLRVPSWCEGAGLRVNGAPVALTTAVRKGYARVRRLWSPGDLVELELPMPVRRVYAHPRVRADAGRVALQRGPLVYCLEQSDNGAALDSIALPQAAPLRAMHEADLLGGVTVVSGRGVKAAMSPRAGPLYVRRGPRARAATVRAVPYCTWGNRSAGEMLVWVREC